MGGSKRQKFGAAVRGLCPRCGSRTLFTRAAALNERCSTCGLDLLSFAGNARVEALFGFIIAFAVGAAAVLVERAYRPPIALHLLWFPITIAAIAAGLRLIKALSVALAYVDEVQG